MCKMKRVFSNGIHPVNFCYEISNFDEVQERAMRFNLMHVRPNVG